MDVKLPYLNGALQEEIYMEPPPSFDIPKGMIFHLIKAVYGTKQGGCVWYNNIQATLHTMGYHHTIANHAVFTCTIGGSPSIIALYINDITMVCRDLDCIQQDKATLQRWYQMTNLGEIAWILGMHITKDHKVGWITLFQEKFSKEILERFGKLDIWPISTPTHANEHLTKLKSVEVNVKQYQQAIS